MRTKAMKKLVQPGVRVKPKAVKGERGIKFKQIGIRINSTWKAEDL